MDTERRIGECGVIPPDADLIRHEANPRGLAAVVETSEVDVGAIGPSVSDGRPRSRPCMDRRSAYDQRHFEAVL
jgi:hypothetical protein